MAQMHWLLNVPLLVSTLGSITLKSEHAPSSDSSRPFHVRPRCCCFHTSSKSLSCSPDLVIDAGKSRLVCLAPIASGAVAGLAALTLPRLKVLHNGRLTWFIERSKSGHHLASP